MSKNQATTKRIPVRSSEHVAFVIGPGGSNVKRIQKKTGAVIKSPSKNEDPVFMVTGNKQEVKEAANEIRSSVRQFDERRKEQTNGKTVTKLVWVPKEHVGAIIGKGGNKVKKIQNDTETEIKTPSDGSDPVFIISGQEGDVKAAEKEILFISNNLRPMASNIVDSPPAPAERPRPLSSVLSSESPVANFLGQLFGAVLNTFVQDSDSATEQTSPARKSNEASLKKFETREIQVAKNAVQFVIGSKASTIKGIAERTGTNIKTPPRNEAPIFVVTGSKECVKEACRQIEEIASKVGKNKKKKGSASESSDEDEEDPKQQKGRKKKGDAEEQKGAAKSLSGYMAQVTVPEHLVGLVIGARGATIGEIERATHTKIQAPSRGQTPLFQVSGTKKTVKEACRRIEQVVAAGRLKSRGNSDGGDDSSSGDEVNNDGKTANTNKPKKQQTPKRTAANRVEITVPANAVSLIVGTDGSTLVELEKATNATISAPAAGGLPVFTVNGSKNAIKRARLLIEGLAAAVAPLCPTNVGDSDSDSEETEKGSTIGDPLKSPAETGKDKANLSVFIRNIGFAATEGQLRGLFQSCGKIKWLGIMKNKKTNASNGNAIIEFADEKAFNKALELDGKELLGRKIKVAPKRAKTTSDTCDREEKPISGPNTVACASASKVKRPVVIDADNVCMAHGRNEFYSARGLELAIQYFEALGHKVLAVVPEEKIRCSPDAQQHRVEGQDILCRLEKAGNIVVVPRKKLADGSTVKPYADLLTVKYALEEDGVVVSNDNMIDVVTKNPQYKEVVESRRIMFTFAADKFMVIDDPNGRSGIHATDLLIYEKSCSQPDLISFA